MLDFLMGVMAHPMQTPAGGVRSVVDVTTNSHGLQKSSGEKGQRDHSLSERALGPLPQGRSSLIMLRQ